MNTAPHIQYTPYTQALPHFPFHTPDETVMLQNFPDLLLTIPPDLLETIPDLLETIPDLLLTIPDLLLTIPDLLETIPSFLSLNTFIPWMSRSVRDGYTTRKPPFSSSTRTCCTCKGGTVGSASAMSSATSFVAPSTTVTPSWSSSVGALLMPSSTIFSIRVSMTFLQVPKSDGLVTSMKRLVVDLDILGKNETREGIIS